MSLDSGLGASRISKSFILGSFSSSGKGIISVGFIKIKRNSACGWKLDLNNVWVWNAT